jgi:hypothetical protein
MPRDDKKTKSPGRRKPGLLFVVDPEKTKTYPDLIDVDAMVHCWRESAMAAVNLLVNAFGPSLSGQRNC